MKINKMLARILSLLTLGILCLNLVSCGGNASSRPPSATITTNGVVTLPNGTTVLPNGAQISLSNYNLLVAPGKTAFTQLKVVGGNSNLNLKLGAVNLTNNQVVPQPEDRSPVISFEGDTVRTGTTLSTSKIEINAASAGTGNYLIAITVSNPNLSQSTATTGATNLTTSSTDSESTTVVATVSVSVESGNMIKASYLQLDDTSTLSSITSSGYAASNIILFAFGDVTTPNLNQNYLSIMQTAITDNAQPSTQYFLSLGGSTWGSSTFNLSTVPSIINNITSQINQYNANLVGGQITGVDLDLENGIDESTVTALAQGFKESGLLVSTAPQVINTSGSNVDPANPTNLGLSAGGNNNQYGQATANGYVDYIMAQTYNSGGWTVGGYYESQVQFYSAISQALNNTVASNCTSATNLCILQGTQIAIGELSNAAANGGTNSNNIYNSDGAESQPYNQESILTQLNDQIPTVQADYANIGGIMQWSLNNDYDPSASVSDCCAQAGAFSSTIFGAQPVAPLPYFILQVSNTAPDTPNSGAYASATLVVNGAYWIFGNQWNQPISPQLYQQWGTTPSAQQNSSVQVSTNLNTAFSNGATSFTTSAIYINGYQSQSQSLGNPTVQYSCPQGTNFVFQAGHTYNLMVNANSSYQSCSITMLN